MRRIIPLAIAAGLLLLGVRSWLSSHQETRSDQGLRPAPAGSAERPTGPPPRVGARISGVDESDSKSIEETLRRIERGEKFPHRNDGAVFHNAEGHLPKRSEGFYKEYVVPTPGEHGPGPRRLIIGQGHEIYYTPDHYVTFIRVDRAEK